MNPPDPFSVPDPVPDPTDPDFATPADGEALVARVTHEVDADDMFDPMAG